LILEKNREALLRKTGIRKGFFQILGMSTYFVKKEAGRFHYIYLEIRKRTFIGSIFLKIKLHNLFFSQKNVIN